MVEQSARSCSGVCLPKSSQINIRTYSALTLTPALFTQYSKHTQLFSNLNLHGHMYVHNMVCITTYLVDSSSIDHLPKEQINYSGGKNDLLIYRMCDY